MLIPYLRIKEDVSFHGCNNLPLSINIDERMYELNMAMKRVNNLLQV